MARKKKNENIVKYRIPAGIDAATSSVALDARNLRSTNCITLLLALMITSG